MCEICEKILKSDRSKNQLYIYTYMYISEKWGNGKRL